VIAAHKEKEVTLFNRSINKSSVSGDIIIVAAHAIILIVDDPELTS
jgi:hypothetical protein